MKFIRIWLARMKLRHIHSEIESIDAGIINAGRQLDLLITQERIARSALFELEHPQLFVNKPSCVYGAGTIPLPQVQPVADRWKPKDVVVPIRAQE